ncbi:MAG: hypothetical protein HC850_07415 [Rhodomicrobium sp.]|nr:hypothetical protein [Rhodomicrobium sp.]
MIKTAMAAAFIALVAAVPAHAATDCAAKYDGFWEKLMKYGAAKPTTEQVVAVNRAAIRAYDACQSGDETNVKEFWEKLSKYGAAKDDAKAFFEQLSQYGSAK